MRVAIRANTARQEAKKKGIKTRSGKGEFFFYYQDSDMKKLAKKYGDVIFLDATYRTNAYGFPLFFLVVRDVHGNGRVIAAFLTQQKDQ